MTTLSSDRTKVTKKHLNVALIGNPNSGKTTLFNQLTGSRQYVGNWPGVTVEKKEGKLSYKNEEIKIIDLPGIYSLSPYSSEEIVTRNCLLHDDVDLIINIIDSTNIERNLYLTTQIMELGKPIVVVLNMIDILEKKGDKIDYHLLSKLLSVAVIPMSANKHDKIENLMDSCLDIINQKASSKIQDVQNIYAPEIDSILNNIEKILKNSNNKFKVNPRWLAVKLFSEDHDILKNVHLTEDELSKINFYKNSVSPSKNTDRQMIISECRYDYICSICKKCVHKNLKNDKLSITDKIDKIVTNKVLALPIFLAIMMLIFYITFGPVGNYFKSWAEFLINDIIGNSIEKLLISLNASSWAKSLILDGVVKGVGSVISFFPQIMILFTLLSVLEDSGYMARAAFITDKMLRKIGLSGKAFVPLLMGFGCSVPAVLGTRILEHDKDKKLTILMIPFMSCSAKMPVYSMFISAFFPSHQPIIIFSIYLLGILVAIFTAFLFKNTILKGKEAPFIMELPEYKLPTLKNLSLHVWERLKDFLVKAGTVLVGATIVIWFLQSFNFSLHTVQDSSDSILAYLGAKIAPIFTLCGFNDWKASVALISGIIAKESVVSTSAILYNTEASMVLHHALSQHFSMLSAYSFMVFVLLYTPCVAALSAIRKEMKSVKWTTISILYQLITAWFVSALVFQIGTLIKNCLGGL